MIVRKTMSIGYKILEEKWVFKIKKDRTYKARQVIKGYEQVEGIDYQEIFIIVVRVDSYRTLLIIAAMLDQDIENIVFDSTFLYGKIDYEIYIELPARFTGNTNKYGRLLKSLYDLK